MSVEQPIRPIQSFSTRCVPEAKRFDYWIHVLGQSLWPVTKWTVPPDFNVQLQEANLGCLTLTSEIISPHDSHRTPSDVENSGDRCFLLFANKSSWIVAHRDGCERYDPGEAVIVDSRGELLTKAPSGFQGPIIKLPEHWVRTWLPNPELVVGRRITWDSKWGQAFLSMVSQFTPEFASAPPLPHGVLVDQLGAMLALITGEFEVGSARNLLKKFNDCIRERCTDPQLTATDVAASLQVEPQLLHKVLGASNQTFASQLVDARVEAAMPMLTSRSFSDVKSAEIARQVGFLNASHFSRAVRKRTGRAPKQLRP